MKDLGLKLFSLLAAIVLSFVVGGEQNTSVVAFNSRLEIKNLSENKILISPSNPQVLVTVRGPSFLLKTLTSLAPSLIYKAPGLLPDKVTINTQALDLHLPPLVDIIKLEPSEMDLKFDTLITKNMRVEVPRVGQVPGKLYLESAKVMPEEVTLKGPERELANIKSIQTYPLDLNSITASGVYELTLRLPTSVQAVGIDEVKVQVELKEK